jgi:hypothetical protein
MQFSKEYETIGTFIPSVLNQGELEGFLRRNNIDCKVLGGSRAYMFAVPKGCAEKAVKLLTNSELRGKVSIWTTDKSD